MSLEWSLCHAKMRWTIDRAACCLLFVTAQGPYPSTRCSYCCSLEFTLPHRQGLGPTQAKLPCRAFQIERGGSSQPLCRQHESAAQAVAAFVGFSGRAACYSIRSWCSDLSARIYTHVYKALRGKSKLSAASQRWSTKKHAIANLSRKLSSRRQNLCYCQATCQERPLCRCGQ